MLSLFRRESRSFVQQRRVQHGQSPGLGLPGHVPHRPALGGRRQDRDYSLSHAAPLGPPAQPCGTARVSPDLLKQFQDRPFRHTARLGIAASGMQGRRLRALTTQRQVTEYGRSWSGRLDVPGPRPCTDSCSQTHPCLVTPVDSVGNVCTPESAGTSVRISPQSWLGSRLTWRILEAMTTPGQVTAAGHLISGSAASYSQVTGISLNVLNEWRQRGSPCNRYEVTNPSRGSRFDGRGYRMRKMPAAVAIVPLLAKDRERSAEPGPCGRTATTQTDTVFWQAAGRSGNRDHAGSSTQLSRKAE